jgi:rubrerythrin
VSRAGGAPAEATRALAAAAWSFRWQVELEAEERFARLAGRLEGAGAAEHLVELARRASRDERRHAELCAELAAAHGQPVSGAPPPPPEVAPARLRPDQALLYELVAACCVAESGSVAVLTSLLAAAREPRLRAVLHQLAGDEVGHARLGWAWLASEHWRGATAFLGPLLPAMLRGSIDDDLFGPVDRAREDPGLLEAGVLPHTAKRALFVETLDRVIFPGLDGAGIDTGAGRTWLAEQCRALPGLAGARP